MQYNRTNALTSHLAPSNRMGATLGGYRKMADFDSHSYTPVYPGPNEVLLEAQARVCTGPHQTRPLGINVSDFPQPEPLLETLLKS